MELIELTVKLSEPRMNALMKMRLRMCQCISTVLLLISCASDVPKQTFLTSNAISTIKKVAIITAINTPDITYDSGKSGAAFALLGLLGALPVIIDEISQSKEIGTKVDLNSLEDKITYAFMTPIENASCFDRVDHIKSKLIDDRELSKTGYDAIIFLVIKSISLTHRTGSLIHLQIDIQGQMKYLQSGKILWDRNEVMSSPELHTLEYYKTNGLRELDAILEKAGQRLAYDFVYLK